MNLPISLLAPWSALVAAAVIPPLVLLYFLKLKRREQPISSTLLWKRAVEDLQVNSPFQRLRNNLLLLLQILVLLLAVFAITEPIWKRAKAREKTIIVLVDQSASMSTVEADGRTRLEKARELARQMVDDMGAADQMMIVAFAERARTVASFTNDKTLLKKQIDAIEPTDAPTRLRDALTLAQAYSTPVGEGIGVTASPLAPAHLILLSDGRIADAAELTLRRGTMEMVSVGAAANNVGIVNMDIRRNYEQPEKVSVVVRVRNFGPEPVRRDLSLFIDGEMKEVRELGTLAANVRKATSAPADAAEMSDMPPEGSEIVVAFDIAHETAGRIEARLSGSDALPADDRAFGTIDAPRPVSTLLVTRGNYFLKLALAALPGQPPVILSPEQYEAAKDEELLADGRMRYDVVVFDACSTDRLPPGNYIFFGGVPKLDDVKITGEVRNGLFVDWDNTHPVLRHVVVELIHVLQWNRLEMPREAQTLIEGTDGPVLSLLGRDRRQFLICAFSLFDPAREHLNTSWVIDVQGFPVFMYDAVQFLAGNISAAGNRSFPPDAAVAIPARPGAKAVAVRRPDGSKDSAPVREDGVAYYANTTRAGLYVAENAAGDNAAFAINLFDDQESNIRPRPQLRLGTERIAGAPAAERVNRPLWPYLILAALLMSFVEWIIYNRRVFV